MIHFFGLSRLLDAELVVFFAGFLKFLLNFSTFYELSSIHHRQVERRRKDWNQDFYESHLNNLNNDLI